MNLETEIFITFILRVIYSAELFICAGLLFYITELFHSERLKLFLKGLYIWVITLSFSRIFATLFDYFFNFGTGSISLLVNNLCWLYAIWFLMKFAIKLSQDKNKQSLAIHKTESSFEEVLRILENNSKKTNRLEQDLIKRL
jgi:DNA integrity scanning protein DisA with diadenylate cyclase activity